MPISSQRVITLKRRPILIFEADNTITANKRTHRREIIHTPPDRVQSPSSSKPTTPQDTNISFDDLQEFPEKTKCTKLLLTPLLILLTLLIMCIVGIAIVLPLVLTQHNLTTTKASTITTTSVITTTTTSVIKTTTTSVITTTTTPSCVSPYIRAPSGNCVNILLDFDNCGAIGNICSNNYTSCSAAVCSTVPVVQLTNATSIWTGGINGPADDDIFNVILPFPITLYNTTTSHIQVTTNGVLCLSSCSDAWMEGSLPSTSFGTAVFPYWDDLYIYSKTWQGIYFASNGNAPNRMVEFEYYMSHYGSPNEYYQFQVIFFENNPGVVQLIYFNAYDMGATGTVGVQGSYSGQVIPYSFDERDSVQPNMTLSFDTITGTYTNSTIG